MPLRAKEYTISTIHTNSPVLEFIDTNSGELRTFNTTTEADDFELECSMNPPESVFDTNWIRHTDEVKEALKIQAEFLKTLTVPDLPF